MTRLAALAAVLLALLALAPIAAAAPRPRHLWATVNACDTEALPNMMGVRASMPGDGARTRMYMRFTAQYFNRSRQLWMDVRGNGVSKWIYAGSGIFKRREAGYTFGFAEPAAGRSYVLRGVVEMEWRKGKGKRKRVVRRARVNTKGGRGATAESDPRGYSAGLCEIRGAT